MKQKKMLLMFCRMMKNETIKKTKILTQNQLKKRRKKHKKKMKKR
jgi:hypothetical protein